MGRSSGWMPALALVGFLGALLLGLFAGAVLIIDCNEESYSTCSGGGYVQFGLALAGVALAFGAFVAGAIGRSRPGVWLAASGVAFIVWLVVAFAVGETD